MKWTLETFETLEISECPATVQATFANDVAPVGEKVAVPPVPGDILAPQIQQERRRTLEMKLTNSFGSSLASNLRSRIPADPCESKL